MVKVWFAPEATETEPEGEMDPPEPADADMVYVAGVWAAKVADTVWPAVILDKV